VIKNIAPDITLGQIIRGVLPFVGLMFVAGRPDLPPARASRRRCPTRSWARCRARASGRSDAVGVAAAAGRAPWENEMRTSP
jgi:hypothetical protein